MRCMGKTAAELPTWPYDTEDWMDNTFTKLSSHRRAALENHCDNGTVKVSPLQPISVGVVAALVGYTSSFAVVLAGLQAVGATISQAALGLIALNLIQGMANVWLSWRKRIPIMTAWSTPGAAILISSAGVSSGWPAAVGAFVVCGILILATAAWPFLGRLIASIPTALSHAMLAGVLLTICVQPVIALADNPVVVAPILVVWALLMRWIPRWATPAAFGLALIVIGVAVVRSGSGLTIPDLDAGLTVPEFTLSAAIGIAIPLYIVTMASQNIPGVAIMQAHGYEVPWRQSLLITGASTVVGAPAGAHALNLAAITAALPASAEAHPDASRRWIAANSAGWTYILLGALTPVLTAAVTQAPTGIIETVAGLALIGTLVSSLATAFQHAEQRIATGVTFLVAASPVVILGIGAAFWGLLLGVGTWMLFNRGQGPSA